MPTSIRLLLVACLANLVSLSAGRADGRPESMHDGVPLDAWVNRVKTEPKPAERNKAAAPIGKIGAAAKDAVPDLIAGLWAETDGQVRLGVADVLAVVGVPAVPALLVDLRDSGDVFVRTRSAVILGQIGSAAAKDTAAPLLTVNL